MRMKSSRLPIEAIPRREKMHGLMLSVCIRDVNILTWRIHSYVYCGKEREGVYITKKKTEEVEEVEKIKRVMERFELKFRGSQELLL